ncbi:host factor-I protein [Rhizobium sp. BK538]|nr:host factor-I protein [Rhizobium sp. BK060]MBB4169539.1 host factor-I protein [Rhizobium sp. BK538]
MRFDTKAFWAEGMRVVSCLQARSLVFHRQNKAGNKERSGAMAERSQNLQDLFLNTVRKQKISLTIFLINGVKLTGVVTSFDNFCVLLRRDGHSQLVYKHAISTIMPGQPMQMFESEEAAS